MSSKAQNMCELGKQEKKKKNLLKLFRMREGSPKAINGIDMLWIFRFSGRQFCLKAYSDSPEE